jgi:hypothetical protein
MHADVVHRFFRIKPAPAAPVVAAAPIHASPTRSATSSKHETPKKPLFRAPSPSSSDDEVANELARLNVSSGKSSSPPRAPSASSPKGKGKARESFETPSMYPVVPQEEEQEAEQAPAPVSQPAPKVKQEPVEVAPLPQETAPTHEDITKATHDPPDDRRLMLSEDCDLNLFDKATGMFMLQEANVVASLWLVKGQAFTCWLSIAGRDGFIWVSTPVNGQLPLHFEEQHNAIIVSFSNEKTDQSFTWLMKFNDHDTYVKMNQAFTQGIFEANNGAGTWLKLKPDEQKYATRTYTDDVEMEGAEPWNPEEDEEYDEEDRERAEAAAAGDRFGEEELYSEEEETEESSEDEDEEEQSIPGRKKAKNSLLTVGYKGMSFVVRGDMIGVFENQKGSGKKLKVRHSRMYKLAHDSQLIACRSS